MSGSYEANLLNVLSSMPRLEMESDKQESILRTLKHSELDGKGNFVRLKRGPRKPYRIVRSGTAIGAAMIVVVGATYQVYNNRAANQTHVQTHTHSKPTLAGSNQLKTLLGFQPMRPTYVPTGVSQQQTSVGMVNKRTSKQMSHVFTISYRYQNPDMYKNVGTGKNQTQLMPLSVAEEPLADSPLQGIQWHYVTVNGVKLMEQNQRMPEGQQSNLPVQPTLLRKHNGILFTVTGTQSLSDLAKVLMSLTVPATAAPDEIDKSIFGPDADTITAFRVISPNFLPSGFKQDLSNTSSQNTAGPSGKILSMYASEYKGPGGEIDVGEYFAKKTKNPQGIKKNATPMQIHGHKVYLVQSNTYVNDQTMAPYFRFEWIDPKTNVSFWVDGRSTTTQERMTKGLLEKVIGSMLDQSSVQ